MFRLASRMRGQSSAPSSAGAVARGHTRRDYTYQSVWMSTGTTGGATAATSVVLELKAAKDAHILLSNMLSLNTDDGQCPTRAPCCISRLPLPLPT